MRPLAKLLLCLAPISTIAQTNSSPRIQQIIAYYVDQKTFMGQRPRSKRWEGHPRPGLGLRRSRVEHPNSPTTEFRLGSITKQFTAASILLLQERGKLLVDDPVSKYMPDAPAAWSKITVYNVLTHTSSIPSSTGFPD